MVQPFQCRNLELELLPDAQSYSPDCSSRNIGWTCSAIGETHRKYARMVNFREGWRGYFWEGRFASFILDEHHLLAAARYIEQNPVRAGLVKRAEEYQWSSYRAHLNLVEDPLVKTKPLLTYVDKWDDFINLKVEPNERDALQQHERTGRPLGENGFINRLEAKTGRVLKKRKPAQKGQGKNHNLISCPPNYVCHSKSGAYCWRTRYVSVGHVRLLILQYSE